MAETIEQLADGFWRIAGEMKIGGVVDFGTHASLVRLANGNFVFLDSVNALAIYNDDRMLAEYLHTFINTFRQREVLSVILNVPDQTPPLVLANLDTDCTDLVDRGQVVLL